MTKMVHRTFVLLAVYSLISTFPFSTLASSSSSGSGGSSPTIGGGKGAQVNSVILDKSYEEIRKLQAKTLKFGGSDFDHSHKSWSQILGSTVVFNTEKTKSQINYKKVDRESLRAYLTSLSDITEDQFKLFSSAEKLSFLINAYNAFTVSLILEHYPVKSIKSIGGLFRSPWKTTFIQLRGQLVTLDKIEHDWIRGNSELMDPRIHFALNCAAIGCPALQEQAFTPGNLQQLLQDGLVNFLKDKNRNRFDSEKGRFEISAIFDWFSSDFQNVRQYLIKNTETVWPSEWKTALDKGAPIRFLDYDWDLNDVP